MPTERIGHNDPSWPRQMGHRLTWDYWVSLVGLHGTVCLRYRIPTKAGSP